MESTTLLIKIKYNYGKMRAYPANDVGRAFASIARTKTLPRWVLAQAEDLGFTVAIDSTGVEFGQVTNTTALKSWSSLYFRDEQYVREIE